MLKRHKDLLRAVVAELRKTLAGAIVGASWQRGDLDRELERVGLALDSTPTPFKLPRCGWLGAEVPESPRWTELAPQREVERLKLEQKRQAVVERVGPGEEG